MSYLRVGYPGIKYTHGGRVKPTKAPDIGVGNTQEMWSSDKQKYPMRLIQTSYAGIAKECSGKHLGMPQEK